MTADSRMHNEVFGFKKKQNKDEDILTYIHQLDTIFRKKAPFLMNAFERNKREFGFIWQQKLNLTLEKVFSRESELENAAVGYINYALEVMRLHKRFEIEGVYVPKSYLQAADEVYHNETYMMTQYLPGILLSHFLWPHHYRHSLFFEMTFLQDMKLSCAEKFFDVGIGTGYYSRLILETLPKVSGVGFDISRMSKAFTERHLQAFDVDERYQVVLRDIVDDIPIIKTDWLMCIEVLEHLENPLSFLKVLKKMLTSDGKAFITAALNAPNSDHIYLYREPREVIAQLLEAGFSVEQYYSSSAYSPPKKNIPVPEIVAFVIK